MESKYDTVARVLKDGKVIYSFDLKSVNPTYYGTKITVEDSGVLVIGYSLYDPEVGLDHWGYPWTIHKEERVFAPGTWDTIEHEYDEAE